MAVVINLLDLTPSDSQNALVNKANFNFQQLLALGVGSVGPLGPQGPTGPAGPVGLTGPTGPRGSRWYTYLDIDPSDPTLEPTDPQWVPPSDLQYNDLYTDSLFNVWEYQLNTVTNLGQWVRIIASATIFSSFLISTGVTLKRSFVPGDGNINEQPFITMNQTAGTDVSTGSSSTSGAGYLNDILFLHNFDQSLVGSSFEGTNVTQFYTALESIYVWQAGSALHSDYPSTRWHLQLGSVYTDPTTEVPTATTVSNSFKMKYYLDVNSSVCVTQFSVAPNDTDSTNASKFNSAMEFNIQKFVTGNAKGSTINLIMTSTQSASYFVTTSIPAVDGLIVVSPNPSTNNSSEVAFGIDSTGTQLALYGSTTGTQITNLTSNVPLGTFGSTIGEVQVNSGEIHMLTPVVGSGNSTNSIVSDTALAITATGGLTGNSNSVFLSTDPTGGQASGSASVYMNSTGQVAVGQESIAGIAGKVAATASHSPTANLMVNGSVAIGFRAVLSSSISSEMVLQATDTTVYFNGTPTGTTSFTMTTPGTTNANRIVILANNTSSSIGIVSNSQTIGTLSAKNTAIYQSFNGAWLLIISAPNTLATSGGSGQVYVSMNLVNLRTTQILQTNSVGSRTIGDLSFSFWSDVHGTIATPITSFQIAVGHGSTILDTNVGPNPVTQPTVTMFGQTVVGGSPQVLFPGIETVYNFYYTLPNTGTTQYHYLRNNIYTLYDANTTPPNNLQSDGSTPLVYLNISGQAD